MRRISTAGLGIALLFGAALSAGEGSAKKPLGTWGRTKDDTKVQFKFTPDTIHFFSDGSLGKLELDADYAVTKDGKVLFARVRTIKEGSGPAKGELVSFGFQVKGDTLTISDWKGTGSAGLATFLQGEYKLEK